MIIKFYANKQYGTISFHHLFDKNLSLKAKGLLSFLFASLMRGDKITQQVINDFCTDGETSINTCLKELKKLKYLRIEKVKQQNGLFEYVYHIYELPFESECETKKEELGVKELDIPTSDIPDIENPNTENPQLENPALENHPLDKPYNSIIGPYSIIGPNIANKSINANSSISSNNFNNTLTEYTGFSKKTKSKVEFFSGTKKEKENKPPRTKKVVIKERLYEKIYQLVYNKEVRELLKTWLDTLLELGKGFTAHQLELSVNELNNLVDGDIIKAKDIVTKATQLGYRSFGWVVNNNTKKPNNEMFLHNKNKVVSFAEKEKQTLEKTSAKSKSLEDDTEIIVF